MIAALHEQMPDLGTAVAIDASDMPADANGQRYLYKGRPERKTYSDPDATWGHRSAVSTRSAGSFYDYKLHQVVCAITGLPLAWRVETAKDSESTYATPLLDTMRARGSAPRSPSWTWATTTKRSTPTANSATATRSSPCARPQPSRPASICRHLRARRVDVRRGRNQAASGQVALPFGRVLPRDADLTILARLATALAKARA